MVVGMLGKRHLGALAESGPPPIVPASSVDRGGSRGGRGGRGARGGRGRGGGAERGIPVHDRNGRTAREEEQYKRDLMNDAPTIRTASTAVVNQPRGGGPSGGRGGNRGRGRGGYNAIVGARKDMNGSTNSIPPLPPSLALLPSRPPPGPSTHTRFSPGETSSTTFNDAPSAVPSRGYRASGTYARIIDARGQVHHQNISAAPNSISGASYNREVAEKNRLPPGDNEQTTVPRWTRDRALANEDGGRDREGCARNANGGITFGIAPPIQHRNATPSSQYSRPAEPPYHTFEQASREQQMSVNSFANDGPAALAALAIADSEGVSGGERTYRAYSPSRPVAEVDELNDDVSAGGGAVTGAGNGFAGAEDRESGQTSSTGEVARAPTAGEEGVDMEIDDAHEVAPISVNPLPLPFPAVPSSVQPELAPLRGQRTQQFTAPELISVKVEHMDVEEESSAMQVDPLPLPTIPELMDVLHTNAVASTSRSGICRIAIGGSVQPAEQVATSGSRRRQQESAEDIDEIEEQREQKPVVDYSAHVKMEPGGGQDEIDELEDEDEAEADREVQGEDDPFRQSGTIGWSRKDNPDIASCYVAGANARRIARLRFKLEVMVELSRRYRHPQTFFWRDDGLAVDWTLNLRKNRYYHKTPAGLSNQTYGMPTVPRATPAMRFWKAQMLEKWDAKYGDRYERGFVSIEVEYLCIGWKLKSTGGDGDIVDIDQELVQDAKTAEPMFLTDVAEYLPVGPSRNQVADRSNIATAHPTNTIPGTTSLPLMITQEGNSKRRRSSSPEASRKSARRASPTPNRPSTSLPADPVKKLLGRVPRPINSVTSGPVQLSQSILLNAALDDTAEWTSRKVNPETMTAKRWEDPKWPVANAARVSVHEFLCGFLQGWTSKLLARRTTAAAAFKPDAWYVVQNQSNGALPPTGLPQIQLRDLCGAVSKAIPDMRPAPANFKAGDMILADLSDGQSKHRLILASISGYSQYKAYSNGLTQVRVWRHRQTFLLDHKYHKEQNHHDYRIAASVLTLMPLPMPSVETSKVLDVWEELRPQLPAKALPSILSPPNAPAALPGAKISSQPTARPRAISISSSSGSSDSAETLSSSSSLRASQPVNTAVTVSTPNDIPVRPVEPPSVSHARDRRSSHLVNKEGAGNTPVAGIEIMPFDARVGPRSPPMMSDLQSPGQHMDIDPDIEDLPIGPMRRGGRAGRYRYDSDSDESTSDSSDGVATPANAADSAAALTACEDRFAELLKLQATWQGIRDLAPATQRAGPNKKLAEIEAEIVNVHQQMAAIRSAPPQTNVVNLDESEDEAPTIEPVSHRHIEQSSTLVLKNGVGRPLNRVAGDRARFILTSPDGDKLVPFSMRGCVQAMDKSSTRSVRARPQTSSLSSGVIVVGGCMPTDNVCILALERSSSGGQTDLASEQVVAATSDPVTDAVAYDFFPSKPHANNLYSIESLGQNVRGYSFVTGGTGDHTVKLWDVQQRDPGRPGEIRDCRPHTLYTAHNSAVRALTYCRTMRYLFSGSKTGGDVAVFDCAADGQRLRRDRFLNVGASIWHIHTNTNQPNIVAVEAELTADQFYTYDLRRSRQYARRFGYDHNKIVVNGKRASTAGRFEKGSFDGTYFARGYLDGTVRLWDMRMVGRRSQPFQVARATRDPIRGIIVEQSTLYLLTNQLLTTFNF